MGENKGKNEEDEKKPLRAQYEDAVNSLIELQTQYTKQELEENIDELFQNACASERIIETNGLANQSEFWANIKKLIKVLPSK